jgi:hypothetical protein
MWAYISFCALYRMSTGALLLVVGWSLATGRSNNAESLALATFVSFIPAPIVPVLYRWLPRRFAGRPTAVACFAALPVLTWLSAACLQGRTALIGLVFCLWLGFFLLEPLLEAWFTELAQGLAADRINRFSALSMTINQCCLMVGPVIAYAVVSRIGATSFVQVLAGLFAAMALVALAIMPRLEHEARPAVNAAGERTSRQSLLPLALIWPVLGTFNFMVPVYFSMQAGGNMAQAGIVDGAMGIGMAVAGFISLNGFLALEKWRNGLSMLWVGLGAVVWWASAGRTVGHALAAAMLGCGFGAMRIGCRSYLASHFSAQEVAGLVSKANALSLLVLLASLMVCKIDFAWSWAMPFVLSASLVLAASLLLVERRGGVPSARTLESATSSSS